MDAQALCKVIQQSPIQIQDQLLAILGTGNASEKWGEFMGNVSNLLTAAGKNKEKIDELVDLRIRFTAFERYFRELREKTFAKEYAKLGELQEEMRKYEAESGVEFLIAAGRVNHSPSIDSRNEYRQLISDQVAKFEAGEY